jgi:hypothetical protein
MIVEPGQIYIRHLRATGPAGDAFALQTRLGYALAAADLHPAGLPATAIICIRRFPDPRPGVFAANDGGLRPPSQWEAATRAALADLVQQAARPIQGPVPAGAEAVLFADRAELLACLARALSDGTAYLHWWWPSLLRGADPARACASLWLAGPEYVPAALALLAPGGHALAFVRLLAPVATTMLLDAILTRFALAGLRAALASWPAAGAPPSQETARSRGSSAVAPPARVEGAIPAAPWAPWVPEAQAPGLAGPARLLLAVGLLLHRAPAEVRALAFAERVARWARSGEETGRALPSASLPSATAPFATADTQPMAATQQAVEADGPMEPDGSPPESRPGGPIDARIAGNATAPLLDIAAHGPPAPSDRTPSASATPRPYILDRVPSATETGDTTPSSPMPPQPEAATPPEQPEAITVIETRLGGIFYLINLALFLELYSDFSRPVDADLSLSLWDFLALLGRELVGSDFQDDPVWALLATLAGRPTGERPGARFVPPPTWHMPPQWLAPFPPTGPWHATARRGWLRVYHPAGFCVLAVPGSGGALGAQLAAELRPYGLAVRTRWRDLTGNQQFSYARRPASGKRARATRHIWPPARIEGRDREQTAATRWAHRLAGYVRARLDRALGPEADGEPGRRLCVHDAQVRVTATHLDVTLDLASLPLPIRIAGLDRNPGWVAAAGRYVTFYFE